MTHHVVSVKTYAAVFAGLLVLTVTTVAISKVELGEFNLIAALTIAVVKATLVAAFFMDLRRAAPLTLLVAVAGLFWMAILLGLILADYGSRGWIH